MREELKPIPKNFRETNVNPKEIKKQRAIETAYARLEEMGFLEYSPEGKLIVDTEKMKFNKKNLRELGSAFTNPGIGQKNATQTMFALFGNSKVISKEDYEGGIREVKPLFYFPSNVEDALDIKKIKQTKFYLTLKDVLHANPYTPKFYGNIPGKELSAKEIDLALRIYHPDFGDGYRDPKTGILYIKNKKGEFKKISANLLEELFGTYGNPKKKGESLYAGRSFIETQTPHLKKAGLLIPEDFRVISGSSTSKEYRIEKRAAGRKGQIMLNGVEHILGTQYKGKEIAKISSDLGGILEEDAKGNKRLIAIFTIYKPEKAEKTEKGYFMARILETDPRPFNAEKFYARFPKESLEAYKQRIQGYESFEYTLKISKDISRETGINLTDFDFKQQQLIITLAKEMGMDNFIQFIQEYGRDGLLACSVLETGKDTAHILTEIAKQETSDKKFAARLIFRKYNEIVGKIEEIRKFLEKNLSQNKNYNSGITDQMTAKLLNKGKALLENFSQRIKSANIDEIADALESVETGVTVFSSFLQSARELGQEIDFDTIKDLDLDIIGFEDKFNMDKDEIMDLAVECRSGENKKKDKIISGVAIKDLKKALEEKASMETGNKHKFYVLSYQESPIAFLRFEKMEDGSLYAGSLSLHKDIKGLDGGRFVNESLLRESRSNDIKAIVGIDKKTLPFYTAELGFEVDGYVENYKNSGESFFTIRLPRKNNPGRSTEEKSEYKKLTRTARDFKDIDSLIESQKDEIVLRIDKDQLQETVRKILVPKNDKLKNIKSSNKGYKIVWYSRIGKERILIFEKIV